MVTVSAQKRVTYIIDKVKSFEGHVIRLESGKTRPADILVNAREGFHPACQCSLILLNACMHEECSTAPVLRRAV